jgi:hypothetical protein
MNNENTGFIMNFINSSAKTPVSARFIWKTKSPASQWYGTVWRSNLTLETSGLVLLHKDRVHWKLSLPLIKPDGGF